MTRKAPVPESSLRASIENLAFLAGVAVIVAGVWRWSTSAGLILLGVVLIGFAIARALVARIEKAERGGS